MDDALRELERQIWGLTTRVAVIEQRLAVVTWVYRSMAGAVIAAAASKILGVW